MRNGLPGRPALENPARGPEDLKGMVVSSVSTMEEETRLDAMARPGLWRCRNRGAGDTRSHRVSDVSAVERRPTSRAVGPGLPVQERHAVRAQPGCLPLAAPPRGRSSRTSG